MMTSTVVNWWQGSLTEVGVQGMERLLSRDATWDEVLASGRHEFELVQKYSHLQTGANRTVVEIGCGIGRVTQALGLHYGRVIGLDVAPELLQQARAYNTNPAISFELSNGRELPKLTCGPIHTVFSYEVLYILPPAVFRRYVQDACAMLEPGGEFVFQMNLVPLRWTTRGSYLIRELLWRCGVKEWRGWPTGPGFRRHAYSRELVCHALQSVGFEVVLANLHDLRRAWFVARKPITSPTSS